MNLIALMGAHTLGRGDFSGHRGTWVETDEEAQVSLVNIASDFFALPLKVFIFILRSIFSRSLTTSTTKSYSTAFGGQSTWAKQHRIG